jgi:phosphate transport system protein
MNEARLTFHQQLDEIQRDLVRVAARVIEAIHKGTHALLDVDLAAAQALIDDDDEIDALTLEIEERCFTVLVLQQPMAGDMRAVVTAIRLTSEIERSADLMVNVAKTARRLYGSEVPPTLRSLLVLMAEEAAKLFGLAIDAYADGDSDLGAAIDDLDDRLDQLHKDFIRAILEVHTDAHDVQMAVQLALVGRYYERIGDHAVNIGERVRYMVTGWMPEHTGAARVAARAQHPPAVPGTPAPAAEPVGPEVCAGGDDEVT